MASSSEMTSAVATGAGCAEVPAVVMFRVLHRRCLRAHANGRESPLVTRTYGDSCRPVWGSQGNRRGLGIFGVGTSCIRRNCLNPRPCGTVMAPADQG